ncbi:hypothetical protein ACFPH6_42165 [Streptomyces xiangluensis]|uniref:Uncharacterized protein n=1 Tax=Streptomyces xiangluensis TaxID=2665720 RepID=A0ABV8Z3D9_9ACTN
MRSARVLLGSAVLATAALTLSAPAAFAAPGDHAVVQGHDGKGKGIKKHGHGNGDGNPSSSSSSSSSASSSSSSGGGFGGGFGGVVSVPACSVVTSEGSSVFTCLPGATAVF